MASPKPTLVVITLPTAEKMSELFQKHSGPAIELFLMRFDSHAGDTVTRDALRNAIIRDLAEVFRSTGIDIHEELNTDDFKFFVRHLIEISEVDDPGLDFAVEKLADEVIGGVLATAPA